MSARLHSLSELSCLFGGPDAQTSATKNGASAEAARREDVVMLDVAQPRSRGNQFDFGRRGDVEPQNDFDRAVALYEALMRRVKQDGAFSIEVDVTPELAKLLLQKNESNRTLKPRVVSDIARDILEGRWRVNGETIIVARDGKLNDGQHRCHAVIMAGRPIRTFISFGVDRETRSTVDSTQTTRTPGDFMSMDGITDGNIVAAVAAYLWQIQQFDAIPNDPHSGHNRPTKQQVGDFGREHEKAIHVGLAAIPSKNSSRIASRSLLVTAYLLIRSRYRARPGDDEKAIDQFFAALLSGGKGEGDPIFTVRELMLEDKRRRRFTPRRAVELVLRAWNAHRTGRSLAKALATGQWPAIER